MNAETEKVVWYVRGPCIVDSAYACKQWDGHTGGVEKVTLPPVKCPKDTEQCEYKGVYRRG